MFNFRSFLFGALFGAVALATYNVLSKKSGILTIEPEDAGPSALADTVVAGSARSVDRRDNVEPVARSEMESAVDEKDHTPRKDENVSVHWSQQSRLELEEEPRDDEWAYFTERAILQVISGHPENVNFDIASIECRTTMCRIEAYGFDGSTLASWNQIMSEMYREPWARFNVSGRGAGDYEGRFVVVETLNDYIEQTE